MEIDNKTIKAIISVVILGIIIYILMKLMTKTKGSESYSDSFWRKVNPAETFSDTQWINTKSKDISKLARKEWYSPGNGDEVINWGSFATKKLFENKENETYDPEWQSLYLIKQIPGYNEYQAKYRK